MSIVFCPRSKSHFGLCLIHFIQAIISLRLFFIHLYCHHYWSHNYLLTTIFLTVRRTSPAHTLRCNHGEKVPLTSARNSFELNVRCRPRRGPCDVLIWFASLSNCFPFFFFFFTIINYTHYYLFVYSRIFNFLFRSSCVVAVTVKREIVMVLSFWE